jgi:hypothetical protein
MVFLRTACLDDDNRMSEGDITAAHSLSDEPGMFHAKQ